MNNKGYVCSFCGAAATEEETREQEWIPYAWSEKCQAEIGPICGKDSHKTKENKDIGEPEVIAEFDSEDLANKQQ